MFTKIKNDLFACLVMLLLAFAYMLPLLNGKQIFQGDMQNTKAMMKQLNDYRAEKGDFPFWNNAAFCGMPTFMLSPPITGNFFYKLLAGTLNPLVLLLLCNISFFLLLRAFGVSSWLAAIGSIAFAYSSMNIILLEVGHITKLRAVCLGIFLMASLKLLLDGKTYLGFAFCALFVNLSIISNHLQMTYYIFMAIGIWLLFELINAAKTKELKQKIKPILFFAIAVVVGVLPNYTFMKSNLEYTPSTIRGGSELSEDAVGEKGLDLDYALAWSYGKLETMTLILPNFMGGSSTATIPQNSEIAKLYKANGVSERKLKEQQFPYYWGDVDFTGGPFYFGIIIVFCFVLGFFVVDGQYKWWILAATLLLTILSWGRNFLFLSELFFNIIPFYNKFRSVNMALILPSILVPLFAFITLQAIFSHKIDTDKLVLNIKKVGLFFVILLIAVLLIGPSFITSPKGDAQMQEVLQEAVALDRAAIMRLDAIKGLVFLILGIGIIWAFAFKKIKTMPALILLGVLCTVDAWIVAKEYLNDADFVTKKEVSNEFVQRPWEAEILKDKSKNFRVADLTKNFTQDARTSYFFNSLSGYHGAKSARYQDLITNQLAKQNAEVFNMLNTKYFIAPTAKGKEPVAQLNPNASGPVWFVKQIKWVNTANEEMNALNEDVFKHEEQAIVDKRFENVLRGFQPSYDSAATISMTTFDNDKIAYTTNSVSDQFAVFSETYYQPGWDADIDGNAAPHVRANYVLRAMKVPAGKHTITFTLHPPSYKNGKIISSISAIFLLILIVGALGMEFKNGYSTPKN